MPFGSDLLAIDWGTTNRRVYVIEGGRVTHTERDERGVRAIPPGGFAAEADELRTRCGDLPLLMAGMVGSTVGWRPAPYVTAPAGIEEIAANLLRLDPRTAIVPGVATPAGSRADVMRGEEVQLLGAAALGLLPDRALVAQPGTHCKWVEMIDGRIAGFTTAMTGELFALLRDHSLLAGQFKTEVTLGRAFLDGVEEGRRRDLAASLFGIRAAGLLGRRDEASVASYASGLLIGADVDARLDESSYQDVHILADPVLGGLYAAAVEAHGRRARLLDSHAAFVAGITQIGACA